jgi:hypothetical protein
VYLNRQVQVPVDVVVTGPHWFTHDFHQPEPLQHLLPDDTQLHLREAVTHATVYAKSERGMLPDIGSIDDERLGVIDGIAVTVR